MLQPTQIRLYISQDRSYPAMIEASRTHIKTMRHRPINDLFFLKMTRQSVKMSISVALVCTLKLLSIAPVFHPNQLC